MARRPQFDAALACLRPVDMLVITKLDSAGRSVKHLIEVAQQPKERDIDLRVTRQGIDTSTPASRLFSHILAAMAEFSVISTRRAADVPALGAAA